MSQPHFLAYNAGTSVLHIGPEREVVTAADKADVELYAAQLFGSYGIYAHETCVVRCLHINPRAPGCMALGYNAPEHFAQVRKGSHEGRRRKRKRARGGSHTSEEQALAYEERAASAASGGARQQLQTVAGRAPAARAVPPQLCVASQFWCMLARPAHGPAVPASVVPRRHRSSAGAHKVGAAPGRLRSTCMFF